jgi:hypothetical protein
VTQLTCQARAFTRHAAGLLAGALLAGCAQSHSTSPPMLVQPSSERADVFVGTSTREAAVALADFQPDLGAVDGPFECETREVMGPNSIAISSSFPIRAQTKATVVVFVDSTGKIIRYAERRGPPIRPGVPPGQEAHATAAQVAAAAAAVRSTTITLDYGRGRAMVANRGAERPDQMASGGIDVVGSNEKFGKPLDRAARVLAQCEAKR